MSETLPSDSEFTRGRGDLLIPDHEFGEVTHPGVAVDFLNDLWSLNGGTRRFDSFRDKLGIETEQRVHGLVIPGAARRPLAILRYIYQPPKHTYDAPLEKYLLLVAPRKVGEFQSGLKATHRLLPSYGSEGDRETLTVEHQLGNVNNLRILPKDETYNIIEQRKQQLLGQIMREFVEFVS